MSNKLVQLTTAETEARDRAIDFYRYIGKSDSEANRLAWIDMQLAFPRLQAHDFASANFPVGGTTFLVGGR